MEKRIYHFDPLPMNTHRLLLNDIPAKSKVLEIGTASGYLGDYLIHEKKCTVWGIEPVKELYQDALSAEYAQLFNQSAEEFLNNPELNGQQFDVIFMGDVLEHMVDPGKILGELKKYLQPEGRFIISLPNIAHYSIRLGLLRGKWDMQDSGILDRTHVRFFTLKSAREMLNQTGLTIEKIRPSSGYIERRWSWFFHLGKKLLFCWPEFFAVQFIFTAKLRK